MDNANWRINSRSLLAIFHLFVDIGTYFLLTLKSV